MSLDDMKTQVTMASMNTEKGDPSKQLHEDEYESAKDEMRQYGVSSHLCFTTDDVSDALMAPRLVTKATQAEMRYFKEMGVYVKVSKQEKTPPPA